MYVCQEEDEMQHSDIHNLYIIVHSAVIIFYSYSLTVLVYVLVKNNSHNIIYMNVILLMLVFYFNVIQLQKWQYNVYKEGCLINIINLFEVVYNVLVNHLSVH